MVPHDVILRFAPDVYFHKNEKYFPCSIDYLLTGSTIKDRNNPDWSVANPTQQDLKQYCQTNYYVAIDPAQYTGMGTTAPMYYAVQEYTDVIEISYIMLYAYQGGQTCMAVNLGEEFDCIIFELGTHQGDVERIVVRVKPYQSDYTAFQVGFEAHGTVTWYWERDVAWNGTHPVVNVALNGHSCHNMNIQGDRVVEDHIPLIMDVFSALGNDGVVWSPYTNDSTMVLLGLTKDGAPINNQVWSKFSGRLGDSLVNGLNGATHFDGTDLSFEEWTYVRTVGFLGKLIGSISDDLVHGDGPEGPANRDWAKPVSGNLFNDDIFVEWQNSNMQNGSSAVAWLVGNYNGSKYDQVVQLWNSGNLGIILYGSDGNQGITQLWSTDNINNEGPGAIQWLSGNFFGDHIDRIIQVCVIDNNIGMIMYGSDLKNGIMELWSSPNVGAPLLFMNQQFLTGNFMGDGKDMILQCGGMVNLGMALFGTNPQGGISNLWSNLNMQQGPVAMQWLVGNFLGDGKEEVIQICNVNSCLAVIMYGSDGNGGMKQISALTTAMGPGNICFLKGDFNGDAKDEFIQLWDNGNLAMIMFGFDVGGSLQVLWSSNDMGQGAGGQPFLAGDFQGDGKHEIIQVCGIDGNTGMIMYGSDGNGGMTQLYATPSIGPSWFQTVSSQFLVGNFMGDGIQEILQCYGLGTLQMITYGTFN